MVSDYGHDLVGFMTLPLIFWFSLITQASSPFLFHHAASVLKLICFPLGFKGLWLTIVVMIWWVLWVWFGRYWWCSAMVLMGLRLGWWVLAGVEIGVVGFGWGWEWGGWVGGGRFEVERKVRANDRDQRSKIHVLGNWRLSSAGFHSFNQRFLSLSSLRWLLPPCWIQWCWFVLLFLLSYSVFSLILLFVWFPKKWRERKIKIGNWDINELIFGFNYNRFRSIFVLFHIQSFLESLFTFQENGGKENIKLEIEILMVFFLG